MASKLEKMENAFERIATDDLFHQKILRWTTNFAAGEIQTAVVEELYVVKASVEENI